VPLADNPAIVEHFIAAHWARIGMAFQQQAMHPHHAVNPLHVHRRLAVLISDSKTASGKGRRPRRCADRVSVAWMARFDRATPSASVIAISSARRRAVVDFAGTGMARADNFSAPPAVTRAALLYVFRCYVFRCFGG
jgi:hypothetical protein